MYQLAVCRLYVIHTPAPGALPIAEDQGFWGGVAWCFQHFNLCPPRSDGLESSAILSLFWCKGPVLQLTLQFLVAFLFSIVFFCRIFPTKGAEEVGTLSHFSGIASPGGAIMVCTTGTERFHAIHGRFLEFFSNMWPCP